MADPVLRICDELGVCLEEAVCYLDGFIWNLDSAMEACRKKSLPLLPPLTVESSPGFSKAPSIQPTMIDSSLSSHQVPNPLDEQSRNIRIQLFLETAIGANLDEAYHYLERSNWDVDLAVGCFMEERRPTPSQKKSNPQGFSNAQPYLLERPLRLGPSSQFRHHLPPLKIGSSSSDLMAVDPKESLKEAIPLMAPSKVNIQNIQESTSLLPPMDTWVDRVCHETKVSREEALYYLEGFNWNLGAGMEACRSKTLPSVMEYSSPGVFMSEKYAEVPPNTMEQQSQYIDNLISKFCHVVDWATRDEAITYLKRCNWDVNQAIIVFMDEVKVSDRELSAAMAMSLMENGGLPLSLGSSSSSIEVDPTETERSLKVGGEENATVASPGMASSQVDGKAVEEDSSMETFSDLANQDRIIVGPRAALTTITLTIFLADYESGIPLDFSFMSNQTVRDIHDAIDEYTTDTHRDYYLRSKAGVDYKDMNITVYRISTGGSTTLSQVYGR